MKRLGSVLCVAMGVVCLPTSSQAQGIEISGSLGSLSNYHIKVPDAWNGDLVIWNHGYSIAPPEDVPSLGPLEAVQLAEGYAIAASSYRQVGWATFRTQQDLKNLDDVFRRKIGTPRQVIVTGASLGGMVTIQAIEEGHVGNVVGGLTVCGALAGSRNWDVRSMRGSCMTPSAQTCPGPQSRRGYGPSEELLRRHSSASRSMRVLAARCADG